MKLDQAIEQTQAVFKYQLDETDNWRITDNGDCEDFVLSVLRRYWGKPNRIKFYWRLLTGKARLYYVEVDRGGKQIGHAVGWVDGWWFDNTSKVRLPWYEFSLRTRAITAPVQYRWYQIIYKLLRGR